MAVTIHYRFGIKREERLECLLFKEAKSLAEKLRMRIIDKHRSSDAKRISILPHEDCEPVHLNFERWGSIKEQRRKIVIDVRDDPYEAFKDFDKGLDENMWVCAGGTKTQVAGASIHTQVAELLRYIASFCSFVMINDEGDYYETGDREEVKRAIKRFEDIIGGMHKR